MQLLVIRHAIAVEREDFAKTGEPDELRPLTEDGRKKMRTIADGLRATVPKIDLLATSPYLRARETAEIVARVYRTKVQEKTDSLIPDSPYAEFADWLREQDASVVAVVGHEPHLGGLVTWFVAGKDDPHVSLKKGGACLLELEGKPGKGKGTLHWLLEPNHLRALGK